MFPIEDPDMKPERSETVAIEMQGFFFEVYLASLADMVQVVNFIQWALPKNGFAVKSVSFEDNLLEVHCVKTEIQNAG